MYKQQSSGVQNDFLMLSLICKITTVFGFISSRIHSITFSLELVRIFFLFW